MFPDFLFSLQYFYHYKTNNMSLIFFSVCSSC
uniref:Uncharacterized protein n=1 Tax=Arundo donax TaxID=35708 RepID=A0A0A8YAS9_ARUDO